jgi:hypothetical protein
MAMIVHKVPQYLQDDGSEDCGPIATLMILDFFGVTSDKNEVLQKVQRSEFGTSTFANALVFEEYGLDTTLVTIQPKMFYGEFINSKPTRQQIIERVKAQNKEEKIKDKKENLGILLDYLKGEGGFGLAIPTKQLIVDALKSGKLVWASSYTRILGLHEGGHHTIVIAGYRDDEFLVYNPWPRSRKRSWENADRVVFAIQSVTDFDYDNGAVILVGKK